MNIASASFLSRFSSAIMQKTFGKVNCEMPLAFLLLATLCWGAVTVLIYKRSSYYKITHYPFLTVCPYSPICDPCRVGEYRIYKYLRGREKCGGRFFFNVYLPKSDGGTTEADVILVDPHGIFVFESKKYSGWIFADMDTVPPAG